MIREIKLRKIGNSVGVVLPKEALAHLNLREGDKVCLTEGADGSLRLAATNEEFSRQMEIAQAVMQRYRNTLRELAK
jgi:putative addiction module antidote